MNPDTNGELSKQGTSYSGDYYYLFCCDNTENNGMAGGSVDVEAEYTNDELVLTGSYREEGSEEDIPLRIKIQPVVQAEHLLPI